MDERYRQLYLAMSPVPAREPVVDVTEPTLSPKMMLVRWQAFNQHTKANGYLVEDDEGVYEAVVERIMSLV